MTDDPAELRAEIGRLRELLENNGIDPDPSLPEPEQYGPPTEMVWRMQQILAAATRGLLKQYVERVNDAAFFEGERWTSGQIGRALRVRVPEKFKVIR